MTHVFRLFTARRMSLFALTLAALFAFSMPALAQDAEPITPDTPLTLTLSAEAPAQVVSFEAIGGNTYEFSVTSDPAANLTFSVVDADGVSVTGGGGGSLQGRYDFQAAIEADGEYYLAITSLTSLVSGDDVDVTVTLVAPEVEPSETPAATPQATETSGVETPSADQLVTTAGLSFALSWSAAADLDLEVRDPVGGSLYWETPTVNSGGSMSANVNQGCVNVVSDNATETASWSPGGVPTGSYEILVYYQQACGGDAPISFTVQPTLDGEALPAITGSIAPEQTFTTRVVINADGTADVFTGGGVVVIDSLPYTAQELLAVAQPIALEETLGGFISNDQQYQTYAFDGLANQIVSINVFASSGSLDTYAALLDANGSLITYNDDLAVGVTDSSINAVLLPTTGTYYIVVSRYAKDVGGTEGEYTVIVTEQATNLSDAFLALPDGNLEVLLLWNTNADLQLLVRDTTGDSVYDDIPRIASGAQLAAQGNVNCTASDGSPFSYIYWPPEYTPRPGSYEVEVWFQSECNDPSPVTFNLYVTLNGREVMRATASPIFQERYLTSFTINADGTATPSDGGIIRGIETLDYLSELEGAQPVNVGEPRAGSITPTNKFDVYTYDGTANETVTIALNATSGTLDTTLYLVSPSGALVAQNDDAVPGENTNSLISDFILPEDGQYIIIVSHYGALYGGTTGTYTLTLSN